MEEQRLDNSSIPHRTEGAAVGIPDMRWYLEVRLIASMGDSR
jgi:hypothetical protein